MLRHLILWGWLGCCGAVGCAFEPIEIRLSAPDVELDAEAPPDPLDAKPPLDRVELDKAPSPEDAQPPEDSVAGKDASAGDAPPDTEEGDGAPSDGDEVAADGAALDAGEDGGAPPDAPSAMDVRTDAPSLDLPAAERPGADAPVPDSATTDAPLPDVPALDAGGTCPLLTQRALTLPTDAVMATLSGAGTLTASCALSNGPEHIYPLRVTARAGLMLSVAGALDSVLMLRRVCNSAADEFACSDDTPMSVNAFIRRVVEPGDYYVVVDQYGMGGMGGAYTLNVASYAPAANAECAAAAPLTAAAPVTGNTTTGGAPATTCVGDQWGGQLFYTLTIPPGQRATVTATPTGTPAWRAVVRAQAGCAATACVANGASAMPGAPATEVIDNHGATPLSVTVSVASNTPLAGGVYSISVALSIAPLPPPNAACAMAQSVMNGTTLTGENPSRGTTRLNTVCLNGAQGASLFYRVSVPSRATLEFDATPVGMWDPVIRLLNGCAATSCLASANSVGAGVLETLRWLNLAAAPREVQVSVGGNDASAAGAFNGAVRVLPPPTNTSCRAATPIASGVPLTGQNAAAGIENATSACLPTATGAVLYYSVRVPAGEQLTATVTPAPGVDAVVRLLDACGASSCLASANATGSGGSESLAWVNPGSERTVYLVVGGNTDAINGPFTLTLSVRREYALTFIPRACDDMTGAAALMGLTGDDAATGLLDLPFVFTFYGERELEYSVSSNGLLQLWPNLTGMPSTAFSNVAIPNAEAPNRLIAAFWDDLLPLPAVMGAPASSVLARALGTAPNRRFVIQWTDYTVFDDQRARMTFQAKLFEGTNAIELHYCSLTPGMMTNRVTGESATVGIESPDGSAGRQHAFNRAMAVTATTGLRFVP